MGKGKRVREGMAGGEAERLSAGYSKALAEIVEREGIERRDLAGRGLSPQVLWRVLHHKQSPPLSAGERVRQAILRARPGLTVPPPVVAVDGEDHYEWIRIGSAIREADPERFQLILSQVREVADALDRDRRGMEGLRSLVAPGGGKKSG